MSHYQHERTYRYERYHVSLGDKRTTASIDKTLSNLLSLHLGQQPIPYPRNSPCAIGSRRVWTTTRTPTKLGSANGYKARWLKL